MATPTGENILIQTFASLGSVRTREELIAWTRKDLQAALAHGAFICGIGRIHPGGVAPVEYFSLNFPPEYLQALKQSDGLFLSPVMKRWLASGEVQLLDGSRSPAS